MKFHYHKECKDYLRRDDFSKLVTACYTIGKMIYMSPYDGITDNGIDYSHVIGMQSREDIEKSLKIIREFLDWKDDE